MSDIDSEKGIWSDDLLNRKQDAEFLQKFLLARLSERKSRGAAEAYVLNIDAAWGEGKSYFLERFALALKNAGFVVASVDAWKDDYADDPLLAVMVSIETAIANTSNVKQKTKNLAKELGTLTGQVVAAAAKGAVKQALRKLVGDEANAIAALISEKIDVGQAVEKTGRDLDIILDRKAAELLDRFKEAKSSVDRFRDTLKKFTDQLRIEKMAPLFVLVDELDRCRPDYAVALLERVKHLFDVGDVVFIIATDTEQLQHAVGAIYGPGFDGKRYLGRFFHRTCHFGRMTRADIVAEMLRAEPVNLDKLSLPPSVTISQFISAGCDFCALTPRDTRQVVDIFQSMVALWDEAAKLEVVILIPLIILHQQKLTLHPINELEHKCDQVAQRNGGSFGSWIVGLNPYRGERAKVSIVDVVSQFFSAAAKPLPDIAQRERPTSEPGRWIHDRLLDEFQRAHGGRWNPNGPPVHSLVRRYNDMVRSAGRLSGFE
jgi:hypothetical protein